MLNGPAVLVTVQGVCSNVRRSQGQKYLEKAGFFALRPSSISSEMIEFHKKYSLPSSQRLIFRGLARGYLPLNAYDFFSARSPESTKPRLQPRAQARSLHLPNVD